MQLRSDEELVEYLTRPPRILFVEDEPMVRQIFSNYAARFNCVFETCETGAQAIERVRQEHFDTVFLDMRLPDIEGIDLFQVLLSMQPDLNFVIVSGYLEDKMIDDVMRVGFAIFVKKPTGFRAAVMNRLFRTLNIDPVDANHLAPQS